MRLKLQTRVAIVYLVMLLGMLAVLVVVVVAFGLAREMTARVHDNHIPSLNTINGLSFHLERMEIQEFLYFPPYPDPQERMARFDGEAAEFERLYRSLRPIATTAEERELYGELGQAYGSYSRIDRELRQLIAAARLEEADRLNTGESLNQARRIRELTRTLYEFNLAESQRARAATMAALGAAGATAAGFLLLGMLVALLLWFRTSRDLVRPLRVLQAATAALARGDHRPVDCPSAARTVELFDLQQDFNRMAARLEAAQQALKAANAGLEEQVAERTAALTDANRQLAHMVEELKTLDKLKSDFLAVISHELLTPLNVILSYGTALEDGAMGELSEEQRQAIAQMIEGVEWLNRMVRNVLDYAQLESNRLVIVPDEVDLAALIRDVADAKQPEAEAKHLPIVLAFPERPPLALADPTRLYQVLLELVDNAIKFSPPERTVTLALTARDHRAYVEVSDQGEGIAASAIPELFTPFFQEDFTSTRRHGGMGLGLAIAYQLARRMNGDLTVHSVEGQGSTFCLSLPLVDEAA